MVVSGIDRCSINVPSIDQALTFYRDTVGLQVVAQGTLDQTILGKLWGLPEYFSGRSVLLRNIKQPTAIELVELSPLSKTTVRERVTTYDYGLFDITFYVSDARKIGKALRTRGFSFFTEPRRNPPSGTGNEVIEGFLYGSAREIIGLYEIMKPPIPQEKRLSGEFWTMSNMAQVVENMNQTINFYQNVIGLKLILDIVPPPRFLDEILHLHNSECRVVWFNHPDSNGPVVECIEINVKGKPINPVPKELGIFLISFETANLINEINNIKSNGFKVISGPLTTENALHGKVRVADVEGPNKTRIELFEKVK